MDGGGVGEGGSVPGQGSIGESPATRGIGPGGIPMRKKVMPKKSKKIGGMKKGWEKSFGKFSSGGKHVH
jgi:hypothetical protein